MNVCSFFSGRGESKLPGQWPKETVTPLAPREHSFSGARSDELDPSLLWSYLYCHIPFSLAAMELRVRALHFSIFGQTPSGHLRLLLSSYTRASERGHTYTHARPRTHANMHAHTRTHTHMLIQSFARRSTLSSRPWAHGSPIAASLLLFLSSS